MLDTLTLPGPLAARFSRPVEFLRLRPDLFLVMPNHVCAAKTVEQPFQQNAGSTSAGGSALDAYCATVLERIRSSNLRTPDGEPCALQHEFSKSEMPSGVWSGGTLKFLRSRPDLFCGQPVNGSVCAFSVSAARGAVVSVKSVEPASLHIAESTSVGGSALDAYHHVSAVETAKQPASLQIADFTSVNGSELDAYCATVLERIRSSKLRTPDGKPRVNLGDFPASELPLDLRSGGPLKFLHSRPYLFCIAGDFVLAAAQGAMVSVKSVTPASSTRVISTKHSPGARESATSFSLPPVHISYELSELEALLEKHMQPGSVFGFDVEFRSGGRSEVPALIQLATPQCVILIPVAHLPALPKALLTLLSDANTILLGVNVADDVRRTMLLAGGRTFAARLVDVSFAAQRSGNAPALTSKGEKRPPHGLKLAYLVQLFGGPTLTKVNHEGSSWDALRLTEKEITYAATDAYAGLWIASRLHSAMQSHAARLVTELPLPGFKDWLMLEAAEQTFVQRGQRELMAERADAFAAPVIPAAAIVPLAVEPADTDADQEGMRAFLVAQTEEHLDALLKAALPGKKNKPKRELLRLVSWPFFKRLAKTAGGQLAGSWRLAGTARRPIAGLQRSLTIRASASLNMPTAQLCCHPRSLLRARVAAPLPPAARLHSEHPACSAARIFYNAVPEPRMLVFSPVLERHQSAELAVRPASQCTASSTRRPPTPT